MIADRDDLMDDQWTNGFYWGFVTTVFLSCLFAFGMNKYYAYKLEHAYDPIQATMLGTVDYGEMSSEDQKFFDKAFKDKDLKTQSEILDKYIEKKKNPIVRLWNKITKESK
jgi:hypothetical protein